MSTNRIHIVTGLFLLAACSVSVLAGSLYVSDLTLNTVKVFDATTGTPTGSLAPTGGWGAGSPSGIAIGPDGTVYVADFNQSLVDHFSSTGAFLGTFISSGLFEPTGLAFGPDGFLYVANFGPGNSSYITRYDSSGNAVDVTPFVPSSTGLFDPGAIAFGPDGNLYIADSSNDTLDKVIRTSGLFSTLVSAGCPSTPFTNPQGVTFGPDLKLYVSDAGFGCADSSVPGGTADFSVYKYDTNGNLLATFVAPNTLSTPIDLAFGPDGNLYVTDAGGRVARFNGTTGAPMTDFVASGGSSGPLVNPTFLAFSTSAVIPEPATFGLMGLSVIGLAVHRIRRSGR